MTKSRSESPRARSEIIEEHVAELRRKHGERVLARQKQRIPPCSGHEFNEFNEWPGGPSPNVEDGNY